MTLLADAVAGLSARPRTLPCKWFYDAAGARLFEAITELPEYYPTRTEQAILAAAGGAIAARVGPGATVVEFGPGDGAKAVQLLGALDRPAGYQPVDIAAAFLDAAASRVAAAFPGLPVRPVVADLTAAFALPATAGRRLGFFPGSTIGNFTDAEAVALLARLRGALGAGARLLLGADLVKDPAVLVAAYDDAAGVTAAFNRNLLHRLNREAGADFDPDAFAHRAVWNAAAARIEMHLVARRGLRVQLGGRTFDFAAGESIHTESSHKYTPDALRGLAAAGGWRDVACWTDAAALFSVWLLAPA